MATLYHVPTSRSLRVLWTLEEIGATDTVEVKSLGFGQRLEPEYLAINPAGAFRGSFVNTRPSSGLLVGRVGKQL